MLTEIIHFENSNEGFPIFKVRYYKDDNTLIHESEPTLPLMLPKGFSEIAEYDAFLVEMRWYLESHDGFLSKPSGTNLDRSQKFENTLKSWGLKAFSTIFLNDGSFNNLIMEYGETLLDNIVIVSADPKSSIMHYPWEAIVFTDKRPLGTFSRMSRAFEPVVANLRFQENAVNKSYKILFISSHPMDSSKVLPDSQLIIDSLCNVIISGEYPVDVDILENPNIETIKRTLTSDEYDIVHFDGHGKKDKWHLYDKEGTLNAIKKEQLKNIFESANVRLIVSNACRSAHSIDSQSLAGFIVDGLRIDFSVGMSFNLQAEGAVLFIEGFYTTLFETGDVAYATSQGRKRMMDSPLRTYVYNDGKKASYPLMDWMLPVLYQRYPCYLLNGRKRLEFNEDKFTCIQKQNKNETVLPQHNITSDLVLSKSFTQNFWGLHSAMLYAISNPEFIPELKSMANDLEKSSKSSDIAESYLFRYVIAVSEKNDNEASEYMTALDINYADSIRNPERFTERYFAVLSNFYLLQSIQEYLLEPSEDNEDDKYENSKETVSEGINNLFLILDNHGSNIDKRLIYEQIANIYYYRFHDYRLALKYYMKAVQAGNILIDEEQSRLLNNLSNIYCAHGMFFEALNSCTESIEIMFKISRQLDSYAPRKRAKRTVSDTIAYYNSRIASRYFLKGEICKNIFQCHNMKYDEYIKPEYSRYRDEAKQAFHQSIEYAQKGKDQERIAFSKLSLSDFLVEEIQNRYPNNATYHEYKEAINLIEEANSLAKLPKTRVKYHFNKGCISLSVRDFNEAECYFNKALKLEEEDIDGEKNFVGKCYRNLSVINACQNKLCKAGIYAKKMFIHMNHRQNDLGVAEAIELFENILLSSEVKDKMKLLTGWLYSQDV